MKIVISAFSAKLGGGQTYLKQILGHFPDDDSLDIILFAPPSLELTDDPRIRRPKVKWPVNNPLLRAVWERFILPRILQRERADILFCPGGLVTTTAPADCRTVTMFRNMIPFTPELVQQLPWGLQRIRNIMLRRLMLTSMTTADLTIFISEYAKSVIMALAPIRNAITIPHGISDEFRTANRQIPWPDALPLTPYLLYVSRFDIYKHHRQVVLAYSALSSELRAQFSLLFIGETNLPEAKDVAALIEEHGLGDQIYMLGAVPYADLPAYYHHAKLVLFASSCENCPNILLEALGAGRPVLSSDVAPMPEFGGDDILYFSPFDPACITNAMLEILTSEETEKRVEQAAAVQSKYYDWSITAERTWSALRGLGKM